MPAVFITVCYTWRYLYHEHIFIPFYSKSGFNKNTTLSTKRQVLFNLDIFLFTMLHVCYFFIDHTLKKNLLYWLLKIPDFWRQEQMSLCSQGAWPAQLQFLQLIKRELCHIATWSNWIKSYASESMHIQQIQWGNFPTRIWNYAHKQQKFTISASHRGEVFNQICPPEHFRWTQLLINGKR
jgi:hypothetical protein